MHIAQFLGMDPAIDPCIPCPLEYLQAESEMTQSLEKPNPPVSSPDTEDNVGAESAEQEAQPVSQQRSSIPKNSRFTHHFNSDGTSTLVKKSAILWGLSDPRRQSSDRVVRVMGELTSGVKSSAISSVRRSSELNNGDWCAFYVNDGVQFGHVLAFKYLSGEGRAKVYSLRHAPVHVPPGKTARGLGVLSNLCTLKSSGEI